MGAAGLSLMGCKVFVTSDSEVKNETAIVMEKKYVPQSVESTTNFYRSRIFNGEQIRYDDEMFISSRVVPEKYLVKFKGVIEFNVNDKKIFDKFKLYDYVNLSYEKEFESVYDDTNNDGTNELVKKELKGFIFINAQLNTND